MEVGFNIPGLLHYGKTDRRDGILPSTWPEDMEKQLATIQAMGGTLVRVFVPCNVISDDEAAHRLTVLLEKAASFNVKVIPALLDYYSPRFSSLVNGVGGVATTCGPLGLDEYDPGTGLLKPAFFAGPLSKRWVQFIETVVDANKNASALYAWEPGNELRGDDPADFVKSMQRVTKIIKGIDPKHPVASGMLNAGHTGLAPDVLYSQLPDVDVVTIHVYDGTREGQGDLEWARSQGKKALVEEIGIVGDQRAPALRTELEFWRDQVQTDGVLHWGFIARGVTWGNGQPKDTGDGDRGSGMDVLWHSDYDDLFALYQEIAVPLGPAPRAPADSLRAARSPAAAAMSSASPEAEDMLELLARYEGSKMAHLLSRLMPPQGPPSGRSSGG
jgi:hypothetical protein